MDIPDMEDMAGTAEQLARTGEGVMDLEGTDISSPCRVGVQELAAVFGVFFSASAATNSVVPTARMSRAFITAVGVAMLGKMRTACNPEWRWYSTNRILR